MQMMDFSFFIFTQLSILNLQYSIQYYYYNLPQINLRIFIYPN